MPTTIYHVRASEAWQGLSVDDVRRGINEALRARYASEDDPGVWVAEMYEEFVIVEMGGQHLRYGYSVNADGQVEVAAEGTPVQQVWTEAPPTQPPSPSAPDGGASVERGGATPALESASDEESRGTRVTERYPVRVLEATGHPNEYRVEFLCHGLTSDGRRYYGQRALEAAAAAGIYDGRKQYINHERPSAAVPHRDLRDWVSTIVPGSVRAVEGNLQATIHAHHPAIMTILSDEVARAQVGLSVDQINVEKPKRIDGREVRAVEAITQCFSVDWVPEGNAYGRVLEAANMNDEGVENMGLENLTLEELQQARPDLVEAIQGETATPGSEDTQTQEARSQESRALDEVTALRRELALRDQSDRVRGLLATTDLPAAAHERVTEALSSELIPAEELATRVQEAVEAERGYLHGAMRDMGIVTRVTGAGTTSSDGGEDAQRTQEAYERSWAERARAQGMSEEEIKRLQRAVGRG